MTSITSKTFEAQGHYQVVVYHTGQPEQFDRSNSLSRQVSGAVPLGMIPELGRLSGADAVVVTHQTTTVPVEGATDRFESRTGAITRNRLVSGNDGPIAVFYHGGQVHAVDNRCPHMGFPLHRGTVKDGILTR